MSNQPNKTNGAKPAVHKKKNLLDDRRIRLALSVLGAIVAWMVVTIIVQPGTTNTIYNVPVDYTYDSAAYTSRGLSIVSAEDKTVNLKLSGDGYTIGGLSASDFVVYPYCIAIPTVSISELTQLDSGKSTMRYLPPKDTAGFAVFCVSAYKREPRPPARIIATISFAIALFSPLAFPFWK